MRSSSVFLREVGQAADKQKTITSGGDGGHWCLARIRQESILPPVTVTDCQTTFRTLVTPGHRA